MLQIMVEVFIPQVMVIVPLIVLNSIFWGNIDPDQNQIFSEVEGDAIVKYSNVEGGYVGHGNIDQDPLFVDTTNCFLFPNSPCVDAGDPDSKYNDVEDPENRSPFV